MLSGLRSGQQIATIGGLVGTIARIDNVDRLTLTIADGITVTILRSAVDTLIDPASTPSLATPRLDEQRAVA
jgi:preprotein translocase subunit YajC